MVFDHIGQAERYYGLHPEFKKVFEYLKNINYHALPEGRHDVKEETFFLLISSPTTYGKAEAKLETHNKHIDIQMCLQGNEYCGFLDRLSCKMPVAPYAEDRDITFYTDTFEDVFRFRRDMFAIFFPNDGHAPMIGNGDTIQKLIVKIPV